MKNLLFVLIIALFQVGFAGETKKICPAELVAFNATFVEGGINIHWETASEMNTKSFIILRAVQGDEIIFNEIDTVEAAGISPSLKKYDFLDADIIIDEVYHYKLMLLDKDGSFSFTPELVIQTTGVDSPFISMSSANQDYKNIIYEVVPNPFTDFTTINFDLKESYSVGLEIYDALGDKVYDVPKSKFAKGTNSFNINLGHFNSGVYYFVLVAGKYHQSGILNHVK